MVNAEEFNRQKHELTERYEAAGGNRQELSGWEQGATKNSQLEWLRQKVEEQERKAQQQESSPS